MFHYYSLYRKYPILIKRRLSADLLNQVFFKVADKPQFLDYLLLQTEQEHQYKASQGVGPQSPQ